MQQHSCEALQRFEKSLGKNPLCTNDFAIGTKYRNKNFALKHEYISLNQIVKRYLAFDIDKYDGGNAWEAIDAAPTIITVNRDNGHAHLLYELIEPVIFSSKSRQRPQSFYKALENGMALAMKADQAYTGLITKNPFSNRWLMVSRGCCRYTLEELSEYCAPVSPYATPISDVDAVGGRNVDLFDRTRKWAYRAVQQYPLEDGWHDAVFHHCLLHNKTFSETLPLPEIRSTANSIAKWTWRNRHRFGQQKNRGAAKVNPSLPLAIKQKLGANYTNKLRTSTTQSKIEAAVKYLNDEKNILSAQTISTLSGVSRRAVYNYKFLWRNASN